MNNISEEFEQIIEQSTKISPMELLDETTVVPEESEQIEEPIHIAVMNWSGEEVAHLIVNKDDKICVGMEQICEQQGSHPDEQRLQTLEGKFLEPDTTFAENEIGDFASLQLTVVEIEDPKVTTKLMYDATFHRSLYFGRTTDGKPFVSRNKCAIAPPDSCEFCSKPVFSAILKMCGNSIRHYGQVCREHIPPISLRFEHMIGFVTKNGNVPYKFNRETDAWEFA